MNESGVKTTKIRKWDEINGAIEVEVPVEPRDVVEEVGVGPSISRNYMRGVEEQVEQNDNSFDGIINNTPIVIPAGGQEAIEQEKKSVMEKLKDTTPMNPNISERKPIVICPELDFK